MTDGELPAGEKGDGRLATGARLGYRDKWGLAGQEGFFTGRHGRSFS
jgi:hypothetical protein